MVKKEPILKHSRANLECLLYSHLYNILEMTKQRERISDCQGTGTEGGRYHPAGWPCRDKQSAGISVVTVITQIHTWDSNA